MTFLSTIGFSGMPDLVMLSDNTYTLDIALWIKKSKMAAIWPMSHIKLV